MKLEAMRFIKPTLTLINLDFCRGRKGQRNPDPTFNYEKSPKQILSIRIICSLIPKKLFSSKGESFPLRMQLDLLEVVFCKIWWIRSQVLWLLEIAIKVSLISAILLLGKQLTLISIVPKTIKYISESIAIVKMIIYHRIMYPQIQGKRRELVRIIGIEVMLSLFWKWD